MPPPFCKIAKIGLPNRRGVTSPLAYLRDDRMPVLHAGDIEAAIRGRRGRRHLSLPLVPNWCS